MELTCIPKTFRELQRFYGEVFSPLYDRFMTSGAVAQELHAEMAAGLDHLFCKTSETTGEIPEEEIRKVAGHLKRATFDSFKLIFEQEIRRTYGKLMGNRYADVHDGRFRKEITVKWLEASGLFQWPVDRRNGHSCSTRKRSADCDSHYSLDRDPCRRCVCTDAVVLGTSELTF